MDVAERTPKPRVAPSRGFVLVVVGTLIAFAIALLANRYRERAQERQISRAQANERQESEPPPTGSPRWADRRVRLSLLLVCLLGALLALVTLHGPWFDLSGGGQASGAVFPAGCPGNGAPEVVRVNARDVRALHDVLARLVPARVGREYEAGAVTTAQLWTDNEPGHAPLPSAASGRLPAGYEIRWWVLNRDGSEDDAGGDVLEFPSSAQAQRAFTLAQSPRCRRNGAASPAIYPSGAINLYWVNPDGAPEWDILFVRGRRLFRIVDVPPSYPARPRALERRRKLSTTTVAVLACSLPEARCPTARASIRDTSFASLKSRSPIGPGAGPLPTVARASAFAHAVNLRGYLVPGMIKSGREGPAEEHGEGKAFLVCAGERAPTRSLVAIHSPVFTYVPRLNYRFVYSTVTVLKREADARRVIATIAGARARPCIEHDYSRWLDQVAGKRGRLRFAHMQLTVLPTAAPATYRGLSPYTATALRITTVAQYTTRRGRRASFPIYAQGFTFAYGRAVVTLSAFTIAHPFPDANEGFLESALVGRAEAHAG